MTSSGAGVGVGIMGTKDLTSSSLTDILDWICKIIDWSMVGESGARISLGTLIGAGFVKAL